MRVIEQTDMEIGDSLAQILGRRGVMLRGLGSHVVICSIQVQLQEGMSLRT